MRLYDFLALNLSVVSQTLGHLYKHPRLQAESLEHLVDHFNPPQIEASSEQFSVFSDAAPVDPSLPFTVLEEAAANSQMSESQEDLLWSYPYYRLWMESGIPLESEGNKEKLLLEFDLARNYWIEWLEAMKLEQEIFEETKRTVDRQWFKAKTRLISK